MRSRSPTRFGTTYRSDPAHSYDLQVTILRYVRVHDAQSIVSGARRHNFCMLTDHFYNTSFREVAQ